MGRIWLDFSKLESYQPVSIFYHAQLIVQELYNTVIPSNDPEEGINLRSIEMCTYNDQKPYKKHGFPKIL